MNNTVNTKHYDDFEYKITKEDIERGSIRLDPYQVSLLWNIGLKDSSGCLWHILKTISRFGVKEGNSIDREISSMKSTLNRLDELNRGRR
tara:strand:- start:473 stop:742 length:270 start_codon:yes stop_codon:yes gene_type:complete